MPGRAAMLRDRTGERSERDFSPPPTDTPPDAHDLSPETEYWLSRLTSRFRIATSTRIRTRQILFACASCGGVVGLAIWAGQLATGGALFLTSLMSSAVIIATTPTLKQSHPTPVILSHVVAMVSGIAMRAVLPVSPYAIAAAVTVALCIILFLDALHPPALANAGFAYSTHATAGELLQLTAATVAVLAVCAICLSCWAESADDLSQDRRPLWRRRR